MERHIAISVLGKDRPGIVSAITKALFETGCNIEDSSMTQLRSEFAMILIVQLPERLTFEGFEAHLKPVAARNKFSVSLRQLASAEVKKEKPQGKPFILSVYGADKPGIVYQVSQFLSGHKMNITDVQTKILRQKANPLYIMLLEIVIPKSFNVASLKPMLARLGKKLRVDISAHPADIPEL